MATNNFMVRWDETNKLWEVSEDAGAYYNLVDNPTVEKITMNAIADPGLDHVWHRNSTTDNVVLELPTGEFLEIQNGGIIVGEQAQFAADIRLADKAAPTGAAGRSHLWHDSTEEELYLLTEAELIKRRPHDNRPLSNSWFDDFICSATANPAAGSAYGFGDGSSVCFYTQSTLGTIAHYIGEAKHPGAVYWDIGSVTAGHVSVVYSHRVAGSLTLAKGLKTFGAGIRLNAAAVTNDYMIGMVDAVSTISSDGMYFECLNADSNWFAVTSVGGSRTRTDTGVAIGVSQWLDLEVDCRDNTSIKFYIDNVLVATHTTDIPTEDLQMVVAQAYRGTDTNMILDYWYWTVGAAREY